MEPGDGGVTQRGKLLRYSGTPFYIKYKPIIGCDLGHDGKRSVEIGARLEGLIFKHTAGSDYWCVSWNELGVDLNALVDEAVMVLDSERVDNER